MWLNDTNIRKNRLTASDCCELPDKKGDKFLPMQFVFPYLEGMNIYLKFVQILKNQHHGFTESYSKSSTSTE